MRANHLAGCGLALSTLVMGACLGSAQVTEHRFSSPLGFEFRYGKGWTENLAGDFPLLTAGDLEPQVRQNAEFRASACNQKIFFAKLGQPASNLIVGAIPNDCTEQAPNLDAFKARTKATLLGDYKATELEEGEFHVGVQPFWVLRSKGTNPRDRQAVRVEFVAALFARGLVYWRLEAYSEAAVQDFRHIQLRLSNGSSELEPSALALVSSTPPPAPSAEKINAFAAIHDALRPDANTSHHFDGGLGFSLDVPEQLAMINPQKFDAVVRFMNTQLSATAEQALTAACTEGLLAAEGSLPPQTFVMVGHRAECLAALSVDRLPLMGSARLHELGSRFTLSGVQTAVTALGEHQVWAMRATVVPKDPLSPMRQIAVLMLPVQAGIVEITLQAQSRAALDGLMATHIRFDDGAESQLFPTSFLRGSGTAR